MADPTLLDITRRLKNSEKTIDRLESQDSSFQATPAGFLTTLMSLPGWRYIWTMNSIDGAGDLYDVGDKDGKLTNTNNVQYTGTSKYSYATFVAASSQVLARPDEASLQFIGNEAYVPTAERGFTFYTWFRWAFSFTYSCVFSKTTSATPNNCAYALSVDPFTGRSAAEIWSGANNYAAIQPVCPTNEWIFACLRYSPSTFLKYYLVSPSYPSGVEITNTTGIPATLNAGTGQPFRFGFLSGNTYLNGRISTTALYCSLHTDDMRDEVLKNSRGLYGV